MAAEKFEAAEETTSEVKVEEDVVGAVEEDDVGASRPGGGLGGGGGGLGLTSGAVTDSCGLLIMYLTNALSNSGS